MVTMDRLLIGAADVLRIVSAESVSSLLAILKDHLRILTTDFDTLLTQYLLSAIQHIELETNLSIAPQKLIASYSIPNDFLTSGCYNRCFSSLSLKMPYPVITSIDSVSYYNIENELKEFSNDAYISFPNSTSNNIVFKRELVWPKFSIDVPYQIEVKYSAGSPDVPNALKICIIQLASAYFHERLAVSEMKTYVVPLSCMRIIELHRVQTYETYRTHARYDFSNIIDGGIINAI